MCQASYSTGSKPYVHGRIKVSFFLAEMTFHCIAKQQMLCFIHENSWEYNNNNRPLDKVFPSQRTWSNWLNLANFGIKERVPPTGSHYINVHVHHLWIIYGSIQLADSEFVVTEQNTAAVAYFSRLYSVHNCLYRQQQPPFYVCSCRSVLYSVVWVNIYIAVHIKAS